MARNDAIAGELLRFLAAGVGNTLFTIGVYQLALFAVGPVAAYAIAWGVGVALAATLYPRFVYRRETSWRGGAAISLVYGAAFLLGLATTYALNRLGLHPRVIIFASAAVTAAFTYLAGRYATSHLPRRGATDVEGA